VDGILDQLKRQIGAASRSLVILCHDTSAADVAEVRTDLQYIEENAKKANVTLQYHTMSSLYMKLVGRKP